MTEDEIRAALKPCPFCGAGETRQAALDLFAGAVGGWSQGLHRAGVETVAACEIDEWRRGGFSAQFPTARIYPDVRELSAAMLIRDLGRLPDIVVGSPPCQDASAANTKGRGVDGERTGLFFEAIRLVSEIRPAWCAFENSPRLRTRGFDRIAAELEAIGYPCWPLVVGARHAGANHRRERVWIIAADADRGELWKQPGRGSGADGSGAAIVGADDPDADGRQPCGAGRHSNGCVELGAGTDGPDARHASLEPVHASAVSHTPVTDKGLTALEALKSLRELHVYGTRVTNAGIVYLREALPNCKVHR